MKLNEKEIMELAMTEIKYNTFNPYEAVVKGLTRWLVKNNYVLISTQEYACFMEQKALLDAKEHQEMSKLFKYAPDEEEQGGSSPNPAEGLD